MIAHPHGRVAIAATLVLTHVWAVGITALALRIFLTPPELVHTVPPQPVRYGIYALVAFGLGNAAGSVLGTFLTHRSWLPAFYLWSVPLAVLVYPLVDPRGARFLYIAVTSHVAGVLAVGASALWILGIAAGLALVLRVRVSAREV